MDYKQIYTQDYFSGKTSHFYAFGYGRFQSRYFHNLYQPLIPYLAGLKRGNVLDVGCAYGYMLSRFPSKFQLYGIDISDHAIREAKKRIPSGIFRVREAEKKFPFPSRFFDIVICNDVIEHLVHPSIALKHILTVMKPGAILYLNTPNLGWLRKTFFAGADKKEHHISLQSHTGLFRMLRDTGFTIERHWTYTNCFNLFMVPSWYFGPESVYICRKP